LTCCEEALVFSIGTLLTGLSCMSLWRSAVFGCARTYPKWSTAKKKSSFFKDELFDDRKLAKISE
jgi:hypothetical protein